MGLIPYMIPLVQDLASCIMVSRRLKRLFLANYLGGDNVAVKVNFEHQGHKDKIIFMSAHLLFEKKGPLSGKMRVIIYCNESNSNLITSNYANEQHTVWGSTDCNKHGDEFFEDTLV